MTRLLRAAALSLVLALAAPAAAQAPSTSPAAPSWDARLTPAAPAERAEARFSAVAAIPRPVAGVGLILVGAATMWATKKAEGEDGEEGVPFIPLISGTVGALTFWYGVYKLVREE